MREGVKKKETWMNILKHELSTAFFICLVFWFQETERRRRKEKEEEGKGEERGRYVDEEGRKRREQKIPTYLYQYPQASITAHPPNLS